MQARHCKPLALTILLPILLQATISHAFYLPGVAPHDYGKGERVELMVNALSSHDTMLPYDYYHDRFHFCQPENGPRSQSESLGSILFGDRLYDSPFKFNIATDESCKLLCPVTVPAKDAVIINQAIRDKYMMNWVVDGLPVAKEKLDLDSGKRFYSIGFELGDVSQKDGRPFLNNHYIFVIQYHKDRDVHHVVGVLVWPFSMEKLDNSASCIPPPVPEGNFSEDVYKHLYLDENNDNKIQYSYNVEWKESKTPWGTRWDNYLYVLDPKIHWFSLINS
ncbi:hypothetical protein HK096_005387, partial [Nowakowskiella sp. JEL0078]